MKITILFFSLFLTVSLTNAQDMNTSNDAIFLKYADECLEIMNKAAIEMSLQGASVMAYIPGENSESWLSKMKITSALRNEGANFLAIAYTKAAEMADSHLNSGNAGRDPLHGEFGYQGGVIQKIEGGYILAVFSGGSGEQDVEIAKQGLDKLAEGMQ